jgi:hypothetical protein
MSGINILERHPVTSSDWLSSDAMDKVAEVTPKEYLAVSASPITVDGDRFEIDSNLLEVGKVYPFEFLGSQMVLWKLSDGAIDLYEITG